MFGEDTAILVQGISDEVGDQVLVGSVRNMHLLDVLLIYSISQASNMQELFIKWHVLISACALGFWGSEHFSGTPSQMTKNSLSGSWAAPGGQVLLVL